MQLDLFQQLFRNTPFKMKEYRNTVPMLMWCEDDKPATKLLMKGRAAVSDSELLSLIIAKDSSGFSSLNAARKILFSCSDNLGEMARLSVTDLVREGNITLAQATRIIRELRSAGLRLTAALKSSTASSYFSNAARAAPLLEKYSN